MRITQLLSKQGIEHNESKQVELTENIFGQLAAVERFLPKSVRPLHRAFLEGISQKYIFHDLERLLSIWVPEQDDKRKKILKEGHTSLSKIAELGYRLQKNGLNIPWINPRADELLAEEQRKLEVGEEVGQVNLYRSLEEKQMLELIAKHDAMKAVLGYQQAKQAGRRLPLSDERRDDFEHILYKLKNMPIEVRNDLEKIVKDDNYYHKSLASLQNQLQKKLANTAESKLAA
mgnify:FL=1